MRKIMDALTARFRKKYFLTLAIFVAGVYIAVTTKAALGEWTTFGTFLLGTFGVADLVDKGKIRQLNGDKQ